MADRPKQPNSMSKADFKSGSSSSASTSTPSSPPEKVEPAKAEKAIKTAAVAPPVEKPRYVRLRNALNQVVTCSVVTDDGSCESLKIFAGTTSRPVREDRLSGHTRTLIEKGQIRVGS